VRSLGLRVMTTRIGLITTGKCEQRALGPSLARVFEGGDVTFELCFKEPVDSFTSNRLVYPAPPHRAGTTLVERMVSSIAATLSLRDAPDYVFAVDDLELANIHTPAHVTALLRDAVTASLAGATHKEVERFRARCSVHFLCPMVEAYFFGEPAALQRAGATRPALLDPSSHLEAFTVVDERYLSPPDEAGHSWRGNDRAAHPKRYLKFLNDPEGSQLRSYQETKHGRDALSSLDWEQVFAHPPAELAFARSLFDDLADAIGVETPFPGACHPLTQRRADGVLRNL
jgi:hypothetical protein